MSTRDRSGPYTPTTGPHAGQTFTSYYAYRKEALGYDKAQRAERALGGRQARLERRRQTDQARRERRKAEARDWSRQANRAWRRGAEPPDKPEWADQLPKEAWWYHD